MKISNELKGQVNSLEQAIRSKEQEASDASAEAVRVALKGDDLWQAMNFRERYLGGWFWGDVTKSTKYHEMRATTKQLSSKSDVLLLEAANLNTKVIEVIKSDLDSQDNDYQKLLGPHLAALKIKEAVDTFLDKINTALSEVDDAQSMETLDLFSSNKGISIVSYMENEEAKEAIRQAQGSVETFQLAINDYNFYLKGRQAPKIDADICDGIDLILDLGLDGFDFMSLFTLSALGDAEDNLQEARGKVVEVEAIVSAHLEATSRATSDYVNRVRSACK